MGRPIRLDGVVAADAADAEAAIVRLNAEAVTLANTEALARILLRAESVASSKIEGFEIGARRLLRAEAARDVGRDVSDVTALEVLRNIEAMSIGVRSIGEGDRITVDLLLDIHRMLLDGSRNADHGGRLPVVQIG